MKIWILEDEELAGKKLQALVRQLQPDAEIANPIDSVSNAIARFREDHPDLLLADIHLSDGLSFELFQQIEVKCPVIFTTAYDEYALKAFEITSVDYLLKPISKDNLQRAFGKLERFRNSSSSSSEILSALEKFKSGNRAYQERFLVPEGQHFKMIPASDVAHFMGDGKFTFLIDKKGIEYLVESNLSQLEERLNPDYFFRLNRAIITHIDSVERVHPYGQSRLLVDLNPASKKEASVSSDRSRAFKEWLGN